MARGPMPGWLVTILPEDPGSDSGESMINTISNLDLNEDDVAGEANAANPNPNASTGANASPNANTRDPPTDEYTANIYGSPVPPRTRRPLRPYYTYPEILSLRATYALELAHANQRNVRARGNMNDAAEVAVTQEAILYPHRLTSGFSGPSGSSPTSPSSGSSSSSEEEHSRARHILNDAKYEAEWAFHVSDNNQKLADVLRVRLSLLDGIIREWGGSSVHVLARLRWWPPRGV